MKEALNREKLHYENHSGPYRRAASNASEGDKMFTLFVERVEGLLSDEVDEWSSDAGKDGTDPQALPSPSGFEGAGVDPFDAARAALDLTPQMGGATGTIAFVFAIPEGDKAQLFDPVGEG